MGKIMIITTSTFIESEFMPVIDDLLASEVDVEAITLSADCIANELKESIINSSADLYIVGSSQANTLSSYVAANTKQPVIGVPFIDDTDNNILFLSTDKDIPTGMPLVIVDISDVGNLAKDLITEFYS